MINRNDKRELTGSVLVHVGIQQEGEYWRDCPPHAHFPLTCLFVIGPTVDLNPLGDGSHTKFYR